MQIWPNLKTDCSKWLSYPPQSDTYSFVTIYKKSWLQVKFDNWTTFYEWYEADYEAE